jgi:hypothetical protein
MSNLEIYLGAAVGVLFVAGICLLAVALRQRRRASKQWDWHPRSESTGERE